MNAEELKKLDAEILAALSSVTREDGAWQALNRMLDYWSEQETEDALKPNLTSEARHYNAGRAANTKALKEWFAAKFAQAQQLRASRLEKGKKK